MILSRQQTDVSQLSNHNTQYFKEFLTCTSICFTVVVLKTRRGY